MLGASDIVTWSLRKSPSDVRAMYEALSPVMCGITGGRMLNFGLWDGCGRNGNGSSSGSGSDNCDGHVTPVSAQENMCGVVAGIAELGRGVDGVVLDVGSGLCAPAAFWKRHYPQLDIFCVNTSYEQLRDAATSDRAGKGRPGDGSHRLDPAVAAGAAPVTAGPAGLPSSGVGDAHGPADGRTSVLHLANASAVALPLADNTAGRIVALESAQHFSPLGAFAEECRRVMPDDGILVMALPVVMQKHLAPVRLGILNFTWASEHYALDHVRRAMHDCHFSICDERLVGGSVYRPLADYYEANRRSISGSIRRLGCPAYLERMIAASMRKMRRAFDSGMIEYAILKCRPA